MATSVRGAGIDSARLTRTPKPRARSATTTGRRIEAKDDAGRGMLCAQWALVDAARASTARRLNNPMRKRAPATL